uniref:Uncharacterized protein n=1 Tax=Leersia perrieri TaxID=77586 RepID=A0A0D9XIY2_9ORYZ
MGAYRLGVWRQGTYCRVVWRQGPPPSCTRPYRQTVRREAGTARRYGGRVRRLRHCSAPISSNHGGSAHLPTTILPPGGIWSDTARPLGADVVSDSSMAAASPTTLGRHFVQSLFSPNYPEAQNYWGDAPSLTQPT